MSNNRTKNGIALAVVSASVALFGYGCSQTADPPGFSAPTNTAGADSGTTAPPDTGTAATPDAGAVATPDTGTVTPLEGASLPFLISDQFIGSGFMGDSASTRDAIKMTNTPADCKSPRTTGAEGLCYSVSWAPSASGAADSGNYWGGVYWQSPSDNWGGKPGKKVAQGANRVTFYAAGAVGGEKLQIKIGGINVSGNDPTLTHRDTFAIGQEITLTTTWTKYEVALSGASYDEVLGGFSWVATSTGAPVAFYLDNLRWE